VLVVGSPHCDGRYAKHELLLSWRIVAACGGRPRRNDVRGVGMEWEDRLDDWEMELELAAQLEGSTWVTLERAAAETGVSRAALRTWSRTEQIPSRLVDGPHGPQRLVPLAMVAARAESSPRLRKTAERRLADEAQVEILKNRVDQLELRLAALERRLPPEDPG
jgi:transposase